MYYELLKPKETITGVVYQTQFMKWSPAFKEKRVHYYSRHDKVILLHDNARPHIAAPVKTDSETLKWDVLLYPSYSPDIALSDFHTFRSMTHTITGYVRVMKIGAVSMISGATDFSSSEFENLEMFENLRDTSVLSLFRLYIVYTN